jgi:hypothetical protein
LSIRADFGGAPAGEESGDDGSTEEWESFHAT